MRPFWFALQLLTRLPTPRLTAPTDIELGRSLLAYPLVGLLIGGLLALVAWPFVEADQPLVAAAVVVALWVGVTGALHLDGLADVADAWVGGHGDRERTLEIMKDPRSGPVAVAVVVVVLLLKFAALSALLGAGAWQGLLVAPLLARALVPPLLALTPYVRPNGIASMMVERLPRTGVSWMVALVASVVVTLFGITGLWLLVAPIVAIVWLRRAFMARIDGVTGDCLGTTIELVEAVVLLTYVLII